MGYRILEKKSGAVRILRLQSGDDGEYVDILPDHGGAVYQLCLAPGILDSPGQNSAPIPLLEQDRPDEIQKNPWFRGRILFPFNDRIHGGSYTFEKNTFTIPVNDPESGDAIHGFLYARSLRQVEPTVGAGNGPGDEERRGTIRLEGEIENPPGYPFHLRITLTYTLDREGFHLGFRILNPGDRAAPFSVGWHPYFSIPSGDRSDTVDDLEVRIPADLYIETDEDLIPSGRLLSVEGTSLDFRSFRTLDGLELDHGFVNPAGLIECRGGDMIVRIEQSGLFAYSQVFIPPSRSSIALEPISAGADAFNRPELGLKVLERGRQVEGRITVRLRSTPG